MELRLLKLTSKTYLYLFYCKIVINDITAGALINDHPETKHEFDVTKTDKKDLAIFVLLLDLDQ